nr:MAG TPA: hypothetical protein [Bacteriophage sp.]
MATNRTKILENFLTNRQAVVYIRKNGSILHLDGRGQNIMITLMRWTRLMTVEE